MAQPLPLRLAELEEQYSTRFGAGVPATVLQTESMADIVSILERALAEGKPVTAWAGMAEFDIEPRATTPTSDTEDEKAEMQAYLRHAGQGQQRGKPRG